MATHSSILAWRIPWTEEPSGLQSMGLQRVRHDSATSTFTNYCTDPGWRLRAAGPFLQVRSPGARPAGFLV